MASLFFDMMASSVYGLMDRMKIFKTDGQFTKQLNNQRVTYMHQKWEEYGYLDYLPYSDYLAMLQAAGRGDGLRPV